MKKIAVLGLVAVSLFAASAGVSYYLNQGVNTTTRGGDPHGEGGAHAGEWPGKTTGRTIKAAAMSSPAAVVRPPYHAQAEETVQLAAKISLREEKIKLQEEALAKREKQLQTIFEDMKKEHEGLDAMKKEVAQLTARIEEAVRGLERQSMDLDVKKKETVEQVKAFKTQITEFEGGEMQQVKRLAGVYEKMEPARAGEILQHMADAGKMDTAAKILASMEQRQAAKILSQISDRDLSVQLMSRILALRPAETKTIPAEPIQ